MSCFSIMFSLCTFVREGGREEGREGGRTYLGVGLAEHRFLEVDTSKSPLGHDGP